MNLDLKDRVALVGGASQGIGYAIAHLLASEGAQVAMVARKEEPLAEAARRITEETGAITFPIAADIRNNPEQTADGKRRLFVRTGKLASSLTVRDGAVLAPPGYLEDPRLLERLIEVVPALRNPLASKLVEAAIAKTAGEIVKVRR